MSLQALRDLVTALQTYASAPLDAQAAASEAAQKAAKAATKAAKDTFAPLKDLLAFKNHYVPSSTAILQRALDAGGPLGELAEAFLREVPHEVWKREGEPVPLKIGARLAVHHGARTVAAFGNGKDKVDVYDLADLSIAFSVKVPGGAHDYRLVDADTLRVLQRDGKLVEQKRSDKKPRVVADLGEVSGGNITADHVITTRERLLDDDGNVAVDAVIDDAVVPLDGVKYAGSGFSVGGKVYLAVAQEDGTAGFATIDGGTAKMTWLPRTPSGGSAPPQAQAVHEILDVGGETLVITWGERAPCAGAWLRLADLSVDDRFGSDFERVDILGDAIWSGNGERIQGGVRSAPIAFDVRCCSVTAISGEEIVASYDDAKDKTWLQRWRRFR